MISSCTTEKILILKKWWIMEHENLIGLFKNLLTRQEILFLKKIISNKSIKG